MQPVIIELTSRMCRFTHTPKHVNDGTGNRSSRFLRSVDLSPNGQYNKPYWSNYHLFHCIYPPLFYQDEENISLL